MANEYIRHPRYIEVGRNGDLRNDHAGNLESRAAVGARSDRDRPPVSVDDAPDDRGPSPSPSVPVVYPDSKTCSRSIGRRNSGAVVLDVESVSVVERSDADRHVRARVLDTVPEQVLEEVADAPSVRL